MKTDEGHYPLTCVANIYCDGQILNMERYIEYLGNIFAQTLCDIGIFIIFIYSSNTSVYLYILNVKYNHLSPFEYPPPLPYLHLSQLMTV